MNLPVSSAIDATYFPQEDSVPADEGYLDMMPESRRYFLEHEKHSPGDEVDGERGGLV